MSKKLFFFFILCLLISTLKKKTFAFSQDNNPSDPQSPMSLSSSSRKNTDNKNNSHEKSSSKTPKGLFHKFNSNERSILDFIATTEFNSDHQLTNADPNQGDNFYSFIIESLTPFEYNDQETQIDQLLLFQGQLQKESHNRFLQSQSDFIYIGENVEGELVFENEGISSGEFENGEVESPVEELGETGGGEGEAIENGGTGENNEGSWLDGEVCFEALSSSEVSIVESQQSRRMKSNELDTKNLLSLIDIDVNINIEIEKVQPKEEKNNEEEQMEGREAFTATITAINPGGQMCQTVRICRVTTIPRIGKRCLCRQVVVCPY